MSEESDYTKYTVDEWYEGLSRVESFFLYLAMAFAIGIGLMIEGYYRLKEKYVNRQNEELP